MKEWPMREVNDLIVRGESLEIDKLAERIAGETGAESWKREPTVEANLSRTSLGRLGVYCFFWRGSEDKPAASLLIYRTGEEELAVSNILPTVRKPLSVEEYNGILADFEQTILRPLVAGLDIEIKVTPPRNDRLEQSISPDAFRELIRFVSEAASQEELTMDDYLQWDRFSSQIYSDGSFVDHRDLGDWLVKRGLTEQQTSGLISRMYAGQLIAYHGGL
jgi:hypothetical protein